MFQLSWSREWEFWQDRMLNAILRNGSAARKSSVDESQPGAKPQGICSAIQPFNHYPNPPHSPPHPADWMTHSVHNWLCEKIGALHAAYAQSVRNLRCEAVKAAPIPSPHLQLSWSNRWSNEVCSPFAGHQLSSKNQQLANSLPQELAIHDPGGYFGCFPPMRLLQFRAASPLSLTLLSCKMKTAAQLEAEAVEAADCRCQCNSSSQTGTV
uniref:HDC09503 n=1 Tax=Drosophila melanogaster TaxID=7227 RepID=Q6ILF7_DROME|nr:TPA_inf: HDC09503 [Drosophila melanogaster]